MLRSGGGVVGVHGDALVIVGGRVVRLPVVDEQAVFCDEAFDHLEHPYHTHANRERETDDVKGNTGITPVPCMHACRWW